MLPHQWTVVDLAAVVLCVLVGIVTLCAGLLRVVGPSWGQASRSRRVGLLPLAAGAVALFLAVGAIVDYSSWDGNTLPASFGATASRVLAAACLIFACGLALRWTRREKPDG